MFLLPWQWFVFGLGQETNGSFPAPLWSARSVSRVLQHCLSGTQKLQCLGDESERLLEVAARDNSTWHISEYLSIEPMQEQSTAKGRSARGLAGKLLELAQGRALRLRLPRQLTISNAIDEFGNELGADQGTIAIIDDKVDKLFAGFGSFTMQEAATDKDKQKVKKKKKKKNKDKSKKKKKKKKKEKKKKKKKKKDKKKGDKKKNKNKNCFNKAGRKKKDKDKNMAMMGGMIMMATFAQMFLGKVILIAGSAFIMAKIALLISLLVSN